MSAGVDAGDFGAWLRQAHAVLRGTAVSTVPCGDCTGCCTSGYSIEIRPADTSALTHVPVASLFRAAGARSGNWTVRPHADGSCPMLDCGKCTIYPQRPQTCLDYDCRVFSAAGIEAGGADKSVINDRVRHWRFSFSDDAQRHAHAAIQAAARFIRESHAYFAPGTAPGNPLGIAALALRVYSVFLPPGPHGSATDIARAIVAAGTAFERGEGVKT